ARTGCAGGTGGTGGTDGAARELTSREVLRQQRVISHLHCRDAVARQNEPLCGIAGASEREQERDTRDSEPGGRFETSKQFHHPPFVELFDGLPCRPPVRTVLGVPLRNCRCFSAVRYQADFGLKPLRARFMTAQAS